MLLLLVGGRVLRLLLLLVVPSFGLVTGSSNPNPLSFSAIFGRKKEKEKEREKGRREIKKGDKEGFCSRLRNTPNQKRTRKDS